MNRRGGRVRALGTRGPVGLPDGPNRRRSLDFVSHAVTKCRRFPLPAVVDDVTREGQALTPDTSLSGMRVARERDAIMTWRGPPKPIVSDKGTEPTGMAILRRSEERRVDRHHIAPGKPHQNASNESSIGRFRVACLTETLFSSLAQARSDLTVWRLDCNATRPTRPSGLPYGPSSPGD
ncbi:MAG: integrase core domain-containing protein [Pseudomonadota bacterium]